MDKPGESRKSCPGCGFPPTWIRSGLRLTSWLPTGCGRTWAKWTRRDNFCWEGLRANPASYEILFELGKLYYENEHDTSRARNVWEAALRRWHEQEAAGKKPDPLLGDGILANLAHLEEEQGNLPQALGYLEQEESVSPDPAVIRKRIEELKRKTPK